MTHSTMRRKKMSREMVCVRLYRDGTYEIEDIDSRYVTQRLVGCCDKGYFEEYHCLKSRWKYYLLKLLDTAEIDKEIKKLQKRKRDVQKLRKKITDELSQI